MWQSATRFCCKTCRNGAKKDNEQIKTWLKIKLKSEFLLLMNIVWRWPSDKNYQIKWQTGILSTWNIRILYIWKVIFQFEFKICYKLSFILPSILRIISIVISVLFRFNFDYVNKTLSIFWYSFVVVAR